jgi:2',3'-cyclic-nucleotide 2'-phosphodiesterase
MSNVIRVLAVGDAIGRPGRQAIKKVIPRWRREARADFIIANGENAAGGKGITQDTANELFQAGVDVITTGNHVWANKDVFKLVEHEQRVLRPANFPWGMDVPGRGFGVFECRDAGFQVGVINLQGRVFMEPIDCPFRSAMCMLQQIRDKTSIVFVDFHAEATSEKMAMGWHLDGKVSCVFGTHTHIPTADERILKQGTAYITDIGMTGSYDSIIGVKPESVLDRFLRGLPARHEVAEGNVKLCGILVGVDPMTGRAESIERIMESL